MERNHCQTCTHSVPSVAFCVPALSSNLASTVILPLTGLLSACISTIATKTEYHNNILSCLIFFVPISGYVKEK